MGKITFPVGSLMSDKSIFGAIISNGYADLVKQAITKIEKYENSRYEKCIKEGKLYKPRPIKLTIEIQYKEKSNMQLALYYSLCDIIANIMNGGEVGPNMVTKDEIDEGFKQMDGWPKKQLSQKVSVPILKRKMDRLQMSRVIELVFASLAEWGVPISTSADIAVYWREWNQFLSDNKMLRHEGREYTKEEYRSVNPVCEACGKYIAEGGGSQAHVISKGMGGRPTEKTWFKAKDRMQLCDTCHALYDNGTGHADFLREYPWLEYKITEAQV